MQEISIIPYETFEAAVNSLPTDPHNLYIHVWSADYSSLSDQLRALSPLTDAELKFGESSHKQNNIARIVDPTKDMVMGIFRAHMERTEESKYEELGISLDSAEWDYREPHYVWNPDKKLLLPRDPDRIFPGYPLEVAIDKVDGAFRAHMEESDHPIGISSNELSIDKPPSSRIEVTPWSISVSYGSREPDYLPKLIGIMEGSNALKISRTI